MDGFFLVKW